MPSKAHLCAAYRERVAIVDARNPDEIGGLRRESEGDCCQYG